MLEGNMLGEADAQALADVPDRDTVNAMILGAISGPARGLVGVLAANPAGLARLLQAKVDKGEG
jgi:large subunit ribosomal protein L10